MKIESMVHIKWSSGNESLVQLSTLSPDATIMHDLDCDKSAEIDLLRLSRITLDDLHKIIKTGPISNFDKSLAFDRIIAQYRYMLRYLPADEYDDAVKLLAAI